MILKECQTDQFLGGSKYNSWSSQNNFDIFIQHHL